MPEAGEWPQDEEDAGCLFRKLCRGPCSGRGWAGGRAISSCCAGRAWCLQDAMAIY